MISGAALLLVEAALRALAAAVALWAAMRLLRVENVLAQKAAWGLVLALALAMPLLMRAPLPSLRIPVPQWHGGAAPAAAHLVVSRVASSSSAAQQNGTVEGGESNHGEDNVDSFLVAAMDHAENLTAAPGDAVAQKAAAPMAHPAARSAASLRERAALYGWIAYLGVTAALLLRLLLGLGSSVRLWMQAEPVALAPQLEMPAAVAVRVSRQIASPVNIGSGIALPASYADWDTEKLRVVLAHEGSHVRQRDFYLQLLAGFYAAVTWFSPLGWWLRRKLSELGEAISDRAGMEAAASPAAYAQMLLEFAALPRPAHAGVAMAHSSNLPERIERLLNDSSFRRAFTGSRRALVVLVPAVLFAAMALVRVQAAHGMAQPAAAQDTAVQQQPQQSNGETSKDSLTPAAAQSPVTGQSHPADAQVTDEEAPAAPQAAPAPHPAPAPAGDAEPDAVAVPPVPPVPPIHVVVPIPPMPAIHVEVPDALINNGELWAYNSTFGDAYAIVGDPGSKVRSAGDWGGDREADVEKARAQAHGHFLLFRHDDKTYFIDDPAVVTQIEAMQKPMEDLASQMREVGRQMREQSQQERDATREAERRVRDAQMNIPTPDLSKQMAALNDAVAALKEKQGGTVTREQLAEIQQKVGELQRQLMSAEFKVDIHLDTDQMNKLNSFYKEYGSQMGKLGAQMGELARENNQKIKAIIDESLKNGKAKPVH